ncbi:hypothetical protein [Arthrobacter sp. SO3]|uniref:hypothetical protein n=1 Tax=Arthrobacter sp. SO3 TaxID=1897057 RepID=UPI001CFF70FF|nr:hypothetical protein [Arthrobacter sp. SO3]MCB5292611.1 hypothetical protein [Arthrobacter sp. SO3]
MAIGGSGLAGFMLIGTMGGSSTSSGPMFLALVGFAIAFAGSIMVSVSIHRALVKIDALPIAIPGGVIPGHWPGQAKAVQQLPAPISQAPAHPPTYS